MKRTALLYSAALLSATLMASPVFAADLCDANLQKIKDTLTTKEATLSESLKTEVTELQTKASDAKAAGNDKACVEASSAAVQRLEAPNTEGSGKGSGS
ncbi:hypothetical protein [Pseudomonas turukhanskensis]|uniref:DUF1090 domain-containing protein n=1 Tax=Pseudomonas turukhanskensis TaxID=1806536 RepID=A0A9W6KBP6_9PSED|nr:hypothetical protein [Pseudomonas turukhanskensis]GLK91054.1 hypothetical protein GCM10017655_41180 [Pseudomonas turukhanskensis]